MSGWRYRARTPDGEVREGTLQAVTADDAQRALRQQKLIPDWVKPAPKHEHFRLRRTPSPKALVLYTRQFATMVEAGIPLLMALEILETLTDDRPLRDATVHVRSGVRAGQTLADALRSRPKVFGAIFVAMVEAGEAGGLLDVTLSRLADHLERSQVIRERIQAAMVYPVLIMAVAVASVAIMLTVVVPTFQEMFAISGAALPYPTQVMVDASEFLRAQWPMVTVATLVGLLFLSSFYDSNTGRKVMDRIALEVPVLGNLVRKASVARFTRTMASLLAAGVSLLDALAASARTTSNTVVEASVMTSHKGMAAGRGVSSPLAEADVLPRMVAQMVRVGEETGRLDSMFAKVADFYESEVDTAVDGLLKALEPAMIVMVGVILGGMVVAMYLPIFDAMAVVGI